MTQPDEPWIDKAGEDDAPGAWLWIVTTIAALGVAGIVTFAAMTMPLGEYPAKEMTERWPMSNIVRLDRKERTAPPTEDGPYISGQFLCGACGHEWDGVAPAGKEDHLECPNCHRWWGAAKHAVVPPDSIWRCNCGETLFWLTPQGSMCRRCGIISSDWAEPC